MIECYLDTASNSLLSEREKGSKKCHRCISALICCQDKKLHVAVLCTGTHYNDREVCYSTFSNSPCDGHAESLCYEAAPIYFQDEMLNCIDNKESIFTFQEGRFKLKSNTTFHLLVTEPPCGWIRDEQQPKVQWKICFKQAPHIPKCSSKILICSRMGIQGYVSHLLDNCILVESITILCTNTNVQEGALELTVNLPSEFKLPYISIMHYQPEIFNPRETTFQPMNLMRAKHKSRTSNAIDNLNKETEDVQSIPFGNSDDSQNGHKRSALATGQSETCGLFLSYTFNPCEKEEKKREINYKRSRNNIFSVVERMVDKRLLKKVDLEFQVKRKQIMKEWYNKLPDLLNVNNELKNLLEELVNAKIKHSKKIKDMVSENQENASEDKVSITQHLKNESQRLLKHEFKQSEWDSTVKGIINKIKAFQTEGTKLIDYQNMIEDIRNILEEESDIVIDCAWKQYLYAESTAIQATPN